MISSRVSQCFDFLWGICAHSVFFDIAKTCLYNFDPLKPHLYKVKLGFIGVYIIFLTFAQNKDCGYSLEPPRRGGSNEYPQSVFWAEIWKISEFFNRKFSFFGSEIFNIFEYRHVFVMKTEYHGSRCQGVCSFSDFLFLRVFLVSSPGALFRVSVCHGLLSAVSSSIVRRPSVVSFSHFRHLLQNDKLDWAET